MISVSSGGLSMVSSASCFATCMMVLKNWLMVATLSANPNR